MNDPIPFFRPRMPDRKAFDLELDAIWESRRLSNFGPQVKALEREAEALFLTGDVFVRAVVSCDVGLMIALRALNLEPGSSVLVSTFTFQSTINAILWNGLEPVIVDCGAAFLMRDVEDGRTESRRRLEIFGRDYKAAVPTSVFGVDFCRGVPANRVVVDAAHALRPGAVMFGDAAVYSLSPTKLITSGEGGLIATRSRDLVDRIERVRGYGFKDDYNAQFVGVNGKMSEIHAALGRCALDGLEEACAKRKVMRRLYIANLSGVASFQENTLEVPLKDLCVVFGSSKTRDRVRLALANDQIETKVYFKPLHLQPAYQRYALEQYPVAEQIWDRSLCLPFFDDLRAADIDRICDVVVKAAKL